MKPKYLGKQNLSRNFTLDKISREESRKDYNKFESYGVDIWNAYEFSYLLNDKPKLIVFAFVPETIVRINSYWKHYSEFGNKFGFKPFF